MTNANEDLDDEFISTGASAFRKPKAFTLYLGNRDGAAWDSASRQGAYPAISAEFANFTVTQGTGFYKGREIPTTVAKNG
jgi:hypothetical protein